MNVNRQWGRRPGIVALGLVVAGLVAACGTTAPPRLAAVPVAAPSAAPAFTSPDPVTPSPSAPTPSASATPTPRPSRTPEAATPKPKPKPSPTRTAPAAPKPAPPSLASRLRTLPASTRQVVIVHGSSYGTTYATLETFTKTSAGWVRAFSPMAARIGGSGFSDHHVEGVSTTPIGVFGFGSTIYGLNPNPHVKYAYHHLVPNDWWNEASGTSGYNTFVHTATSPGGASEALWKETLAYRYFALITYNVPAKAGRGSGIFLHVSKGNATAGCVAISQSNLVSVLTWLDPKANPKIVIAPDSQLGRF